MKEPALDRKSEEAADLVDVAEVLRGNTAAFRGIVERYRGLVFRLSLSFLNDRDEAEEASQEIFLKAFRSLRSFRLENRFLPWLYAISTNHLKTHYGRMRRREEKTLHGSDDVPTDTASDPQEIFQREETKARVRRAIGSLPQPVRDAVFLYYFEGMSVEQVSSTLGVGAENVKSRLLRARKKLREILAGRATEREFSGYTGTEIP